jgi:hypothetical protein
MPNSTLFEDIIVKISKIQNNADRRYWKEGLFPNWRHNKLIGYNRPDNSMFFSASIAFLFNNIKIHLPESSQKLIKEITAKAINNYSDYQSVKTENVYNFYPTKPSKHFGNGYFFKHFKHFQLPHDADDTALVFMTFPFTKDENLVLQKKLSNHSNGRLVNIKNTFPHYKHLCAYSTWFGDKMAIEFDTCVLSNILYSQLQAGLVLDKYGLASWETIKQTILSGEYITNPFVVSHNYAKTEVIAYHVARLIAKFELKDSEKVKLKLAKDLELILNNSDKFSIKNIILSSSLARLGLKKKIEIPKDYEQGDTQNYSFFKAGLLSSYENPFLQKIAHSKISHINWTCPAHNLALILENHVLLKYTQ